MLTLNICASFLAKYISRILQLGICMDDELWYGVIDNQANCSYSSLYLSMFLSFKAKFVSQFSQELLN